MNRDTIFVYTAGTNSVTFAYKSPLWVTSITGASGNDVAVSESQGAGQVGSTISNQSVQPRDITINGAVLAAVEANRRGILACVLPGVTGRLTVIQNGESWYIDGAPKRTPEFSDGSVVQDFQFVLHCCCFSKRMRKVFKKNEKSMLQFCNKNSKKKRAFTMG